MTLGTSLPLSGLQLDSKMGGQPLSVVPFGLGKQWSASPIPVLPPGCHQQPQKSASPLLGSDSASFGPQPHPSSRASLGLTCLSLSLSLSLPYSPQFSCPGITLSSPSHPGFLTPFPLPSVPPLSYFLAITSQRHPDVSPQITSRDLGFRSEILYFCTTGWAPGPRRKTHPVPCHCCLHLPG